jgi:hypothetical protein
MAVISLYLDRKLYVNRVERRIAAGIVREIIMGMEYKKYDPI